MDQSKPIIALDVPFRGAAMALVEEISPHEALNLKIGMELFYLEGTQLVRDLIQQGHSIFIDLKLHDIPNTVERASHQLAELGVDMLTVHTQGGREMMKGAARGVKGSKVKVLGVTQLTSMDQVAMHREQRVDLSLSLEEYVLHLGQISLDAGLDGVIASPLEAGALRQSFGQEGLIVTPGIRLADAVSDDQMRIATPDQAAQLGADYIVVGRPITQADNPQVAYQHIRQLWDQAKGVNHG